MVQNFAHQQWVCLKMGDLNSKTHGLFGPCGDSHDPVAFVDFFQASTFFSGRTVSRCMRSSSAWSMPKGVQGSDDFLGQTTELNEFHAMLGEENFEKKKNVE